MGSWKEGFWQMVDIMDVRMLGSASFSIMLNGTNKGLVGSSKGLR